MGFLFASSYCGRNPFQVNARARHRQSAIGLKPVSMCSRVDTLCASGSSAIILATGLVKSGIADVVAVAAVRNFITPQMWEAYYSEMAPSTMIGMPARHGSAGAFLRV